jgi:hypothetical protein
MASSTPLSDVDPEIPVFATQFTCRTALARNLLNRCLQQQSILLYGGPKLGKTSVLLHLKWLAGQDDNKPLARPAPLYLDMKDEVVRSEFLLGPGKRSASILLLDNCDHLLKDHGVDTLDEFLGTDSLEQGIVWAGGRSWRDFVVDQSCTVGLRSAPLAVLVQGEARQLLKAVAPIHLDAALGVGGTHPYVLKMVAHNMLSLPQDPLSTIRTSKERLIPFFEACRDALRQETEHTLLKYLIKKARPVAPREAAIAVGFPTKAVADMLCSLGLICRWNLSQGAMLQANCKLFNDWYMPEPCETEKRL